MDVFAVLINTGKLSLLGCLRSFSAAKIPEISKPLLLSDAE